MKRIVAYLLLVSIPVLFSSCNNTLRLICKNWKVTEVHFDKRTSSFSPEQQRMIAGQLTTKYYFELKKDSTYQTRNGTDVVNGKWWLVNNNKGFHTENGEMGAIESNILTLTKEKLVFQSPNTNGEAMEFVCVPVPNK